MSAEEISARLQREQNYSLSASTVRGWLEHKRLPRKDDDFTEMCLLLVGKDRADELMARLQAARRVAARAPRTLPPPDSSPPTKSIDKPAATWRQWYRSLRPWHGAAVVVVSVLGVLVWLIPFPDDEASSGTSPPPTGSPSSTAPADSPCPTPTIKAQTKNSSRAHATFCADRLEFLLFDDSPDGKSAVLVVRANGKEWPAWFNSNRHATRSPDGSQVTRNPPQRITVSFSYNDTADFRVCLGDRNPERIYLEDTCGPWTPIWPRR
ncbi:MAG: hypothetical protein M3460_21965 [Actinomycetota bacterium]|nr:hypothetical protein [Actinomycetota bacterium]